MAKQGTVVPSFFVSNDGGWQQLHPSNGGSEGNLPGGYSYAVGDGQSHTMSIAMEIPNVDPGYEVRRMTFRGTVGFVTAHGVLDIDAYLGAVKLRDVADYAAGGPQGYYDFPPSGPMTKILSSADLSQIRYVITGLGTFPSYAIVANLWVDWEAELAPHWGVRA